MFGDDITDIDFKKMYSFHLKRRAPITMAVLKVKDIRGSGVVEVDGDVVTGFLEKPDPKTVRSRLIAGGIYIFSRGSLRLLPNRREFSLSKDFFESVADKRVIYAYRSRHNWYPIDTPERYRKARYAFERVRR
jgi:mannose-1-phosphate guanylyltransferase/phosphomannomutase